MKLIITLFDFKFKLNKKLNKEIPEFPSQDPLNQF